MRSHDDGGRRRRRQRRQARQTSGACNGDSGGRQSAVRHSTLAKFGPNPMRSVGPDSHNMWLSRVAPIRAVYVDSSWVRPIDVHMYRCVLIDIRAYVSI